MSEQELNMKINKNNQRIGYNLKKTLISIGAGVALIIITNIFTGYSTIRSNAQAIREMKGSKVDQVKFNQYIKIQAEINVLTRERQEVLTKRVDDLEDSQKQIQLSKLREIDIKIGILETKISNLMQEYGFKTRDGDEVKIGLDWFLVTNY